MDALSWVLKDNYGIFTVKGAWRDRLSSLKLNFAEVKMIQKKIYIFLVVICLVVKVWKDRDGSFMEGKKTRM